MQIGIIGINHKSAELELREEISKICTECFAHNKEIAEPIVLLSTCNRTELYFSSDDLAETHSILLNILRHKFAFPFEHKIYSYFGKDCFLHLATVTAGLDSAILGESEIQGQVKKAYEEAALHQTLSAQLHFLFQKSLKIGKEIRSQLSLYQSMPTLPEAIYQTGIQILGSFESKKILLVGLSEINIKILKFLKKKNAHITVCNRTFGKHLNLEGEISYLLWEDLWKDSRWQEFDMIVFATKSAQYLLTAEKFQHSFQKNHILIDLSVPRNVDPKIGRHPFVKLINIDQLTKAIDRKRKMRVVEIAHHETPCVEKMVERQIDLFTARILWKKKLCQFIEIPKQIEYIN